MDLRQQVAPAAQKVLVGKLPAVGVDLAEALRAYGEGGRTWGRGEAAAVGRGEAAAGAAEARVVQAGVQQEDAKLLS